MATSDRLQQVQRHLESGVPGADPSRIDGQVVVITGGAQGKYREPLLAAYLGVLTLRRNREGSGYPPRAEGRQNCHQRHRQ